MHLLHWSSEGILGLTTFYKDIPPYAILSHRWVDDEPTFQDVMHGVGMRKAGYDKLHFCGRQATRDGLNYFWVDTVCIDKKSSAELTESLNSMFRWYRKAAKCYVYMSGVVSVEPDFKRSVWFTRGWTLQELIAPKVVEFYSVNEVFLGTKASMEAQIHSITGIPVEVLRGKDLSSFSIAERLSWVENRTTTREEDRSYCLLGIFNIFIPVIYGEGERAFDRLALEIQKHSEGPPNLQNIPMFQKKSSVKSERGIRLLALDGGGIRGFSTLQILDQLMTAVNPTLPPRPCDFFDLIGGTGTGGLIAIMLGRLHMTVKECIDAYTTLSETAFQKKRHRFKLRNLELQRQFDTSRLEHAIQDMIVRKGLSKDEQLHSTIESACRIFVCAQSQDTGDVVRLRSYVTTRGVTRDVKIWEAARATSATTTFFEPIQINTGGRFVDGAVGANNPINEVWTEAQDMWPSLQNKLQCLVSIGTGVPSLSALVRNDLSSVGKMLVQIATETEGKAEMFRRDKRDLDESGQYFRFNVTSGLEDIGLESSEQRGLILAATRRYIESQVVHKELQACAKMLRLEVQRCKHALFHVDLMSRHDSIRSFDSSQWLFEHETFRSWNAHGMVSGTADALLTLKGNPGTGKSVLIKEAAKKADDTDSLMLHHYFDRDKDSQPSSFKSALDKFCTSLLYQLLSKLEPKPWTFLKEWGDMLRFKPGMMPWNLAQLQEAIREIIVGHEKRGNVKVRIFIDAIDESCNEVSEIQPTQPLELLQWIEKLLHGAADAGADVRVCLSRTYIPTYGGLEPKTRSIVVEEHNSSAIDAFVTSALQRDETHAGIRRLLHDKIIQRCSNNFLWTTVVVENVLAKSEVLKGQELLRLVDELPRTHKDMYGRVLRGVKGSQAANTLQLLQIVWAARRPLSADELRQSLAFTKTFEYDSIAEWEQSDSGLEKEEKFENYLRRESLGLVEIHHTSGSESQVRFVHGSVSTFLRDPDSVLPIEALPWAQRCHLTLVKISFHALNVSSADPIAFEDYASEHWIHHARECDDLFREVDDLPPFITECSKRKAKRTIERQIKAIKQSQAATHSHLLDEKESLLVLSATLGCTSFLQRHLADCESCQDDVSTYSDRYCKALQNAIIGRMADTTMWLLEKHCGSNININELYGNMTLLYKAAYFGPTEVVAFLLGKGADPCKRSLMGYEYPLHTAIELGSEDIVRILLQHTSAHDQFRLQRNGGLTPLHNAVKSRQPARRKLAVLKLLLKKAPRGVGILDVQSKDGVSALDLARQMREGGGRGNEDVLDEMEDFYDQEYERNA